MWVANHPEPLEAPPGRPVLASGLELHQHKPPCECLTCDQQYIRMEKQMKFHFLYTGQLSSAKADALLSKFVDQMTKDRKYLAEMCEKFGNLILSRWRKKSRDKREALLLKADPSIETKPWFRPRFYAQSPSLVRDRNLRNSWLLPYMDACIMKSNPHVFLGLLHGRVRYTPEEWAAFDNFQLNTPWEGGAFALGFCSDCVVMHGPNYGRITTWDKTAAERLDIMGFPRGRLVIEVQALVLVRLRKIVDLLLEGVNPDSPSGSEKWQEMIGSGFKQTSSIELWSNYIHQPFSSPPMLNIEHYASVAKAAMRAAEDHLWLLQSDPGYVRRFIRVMATGEVYRSAAKYDLIAMDMHHAAETFRNWWVISREWKRVKDLYQRFRNSVSPGQPLPRKLEKSLAVLCHALLSMLDREAKHLFIFIAQRPGFQHKWKFTPPSQAKAGEHITAGYQRLGDLHTYVLAGTGACLLRQWMGV